MNREKFPEKVSNFFLYIYAWPIASSFIFIRHAGVSRSEICKIRQTNILQFADFMIQNLYHLIFRLLSCDMIL